ncbi:MAG TPA: periplasmic heavy metal sensor [Anaeromyxobacteraceae bacterium]|nr:periplasmic heavy metal sensor [Anaeromyxobacteraceae bacterium]
MKTPIVKLALTALAALPLAALAAPPPGPAQGGGMGPPDDAPDRLERMEKRMRVARAIGLADALDLDAAQATKLAETLEKLDQKRQPVHKQQHEAMQVLRQAARGDKDAQAKVDDAVKKVFDAREKLQAVDRETYQAVAKGLAPEKRARAAVFLGRFRERFGRGMAMWMGGMDGPGHEMHRGMGHGGGMGRGRGMGGPGPGSDFECQDDDCPRR